MIPTTKKILVAAGLSKNSIAAMQHAVSLARVYDAEIHVIHVAEALSEDALITMKTFIADKTTRTSAIERRISSIRDMLYESQKNFWASLSEDEKVAHQHVKSVELLEGHPADVILRRASELECDLIIIAAHETASGHATFLGSTAKRVLRRSRVPTLVVPIV